MNQSTSQIAAGWLNSRKTLQDAYKPRAKCRFIVDSVLPTPGVGMFVAGPGKLKSFIVADLIMSIVGNEGTWPQKSPRENGYFNPFNIIHCPVTWIDYDNGDRRTAERFEAISRAHNTDINAPLQYFSMVSPRLDFQNQAHIDVLKNIIMANGSKLAVIDNLATVCGKVEENTNGMVQITNNLKVVSEECDATILLLHHTRKGKGASRMTLDDVRGFSGIGGALDVVLYVDRPDKSDTLKIYALKERDSTIPDFSLEFTYENNPGTSELHEARFFGIATPGQTSKNDIENAIIDFLKTLLPGGAINQTKLVDIIQKQLSAKVGTNKIRAVIDNLAFIGMIKVSTGPNNSKVYCI
jgi:hypothetical protein